VTSRIPPEQVIADMLLAIRSEERLAERKRITKLLEENREKWLQAYEDSDQQESHIGNFYGGIIRGLDAAIAGVREIPIEYRQGETE
jgi:hypothetical protein